MSRRIKDTETGQREILKMIENLTSKIDSLADTTLGNTDYGPNSVNSENTVLEPRPIEISEFCQDVSQHKSFVKCKPFHSKFFFSYLVLSNYNMISFFSSLHKSQLHCFVATSQSLSSSSTSSLVFHPSSLHLQNGFRH